MTESSKRSTVFLVDDHPLVRESLISLINSQPDLMVCGEAEDATHALREIIDRQPSAVVMDISLKETSGLELLRAVRTNAPNVAIVVLSMHDETLYAERCIRAGAKGYVMKGEPTKRIAAAIRDVLLGRIWVSDVISASFTHKFSGQLPPAGDAALEALSDRELEVFNMLGRGLSTRQVAHSLDVSIKTVQAYCARIKQKLRLATASELVREAIRWHERQSGD